MKFNHQLVIKNIQQAIQQCKEDGALAPVKAYLIEALRLTEALSKKRNVRQSTFTKYAEDAKMRNAQWIKMLSNPLLEIPEED